MLDFKDIWLTFET